MAKLLYVSLAVWLVAAICAIQLIEAGLNPFKGMSTKAIREKAPVNRTENEWDYLATHGVKKAFVWEDKLDVPEVLDLLKDLKEYPGGKIPEHIKIDRLLEFNEVNSGKCDQVYMNEIWQAQKTTEKKYPGLSKYVSDCFQRQLDACNYEQKFRQALDQFMHGSPRMGELVRDISRILGSDGQTSYDWDGVRLDNNYQMNKALEQLWSENKFRWEPKGFTIKAYELAQELIGACRAFTSQLSPIVNEAKMDVRLKQNRDVLELFRYTDVCEQVVRANFQQAIGDSHWNDIHPKANEFFDKWNYYMNYQ